MLKFFVEEEKLSLKSLSTARDVFHNIIVFQTIICLLSVICTKKVVINDLKP